MTNLNMLRLVVLNGVVGDLDCAFIVAVKMQFVTVDTIIL